MTDAPEMLLANHLKTLRLPTFLREHDKLARLAPVRPMSPLGWVWLPVKRACPSPLSQLLLWSMR